MLHKISGTCRCTIAPNPNRYALRAAHVMVRSCKWTWLLCHSLHLPGTQLNPLGFRAAVPRSGTCFRCCGAQAGRFFLPLLRLMQVLGLRKRHAAEAVCLLKLLRKAEHSGRKLAALRNRTVPIRATPRWHQSPHMPAIEREYTQAVAEGGIMGRHRQLCGVGVDVLDTFLIASSFAASGVGDADGANIGGAAWWFASIVFSSSLPFQ